MAKCNNPSDIKCHSSYYKSTCFIWKNFSATIWVQLQPFLSNHIFCKFTKKYTFIKLKTPWLKNNKMQLIIMDVIQSYYTLSNKNNRTELMFSLILIYGAWLISFLWFLIKAYYFPEPKWWNHQISVPDYKEKGGYVLYSRLTD